MGLIFCLAIVSVSPPILDGASGPLSVHSYIEKSIKSHRMEDSKIGCDLILNTGVICSSGYYEFTAHDKYIYVNEYLATNIVLKQRICNLLAKVRPIEIPENAFMAFIRLGLIDSFNQRYHERLEVQCVEKDSFFLARQSPRLSMILCSATDNAKECARSASLWRQESLGVREYACVTKRGEENFLASSDGNGIVLSV